MDTELYSSDQVKTITDNLIKDNVPFTIQICHSGNGKNELSAFITKLNLGKIQEVKKALK